MPSVFRRLSSSLRGESSGKKPESGKGVTGKQKAVGGVAVCKLEKNEKDESQVEEKEEPKRVWRSARDPKTGRTYYYDVVTRETQWNKPLELLEPEERKELERREAEKRAFFEEMEYNMKRRFQEGLTSVDVGRPTSAVMTSGIGWRPPRQTSGSFSSSFAASTNMIRTLSTMDDSFLLAGGRPSSISRPSQAFLSPDRTSKSASAHELLGLCEEDDAQTTVVARDDHQDCTRIEPLARCATTGDTFSAWPSRLAAINAAANDNATTGTNNTTTNANTNADGKATNKPRARASSGGGPGDLTVAQSKKLPPTLLERPPLVTRNSTGTLYVDHTLDHPDREATIRCVCHVIRAHVAASSVGSSPPSARSAAKNKKNMQVPARDDARFDVFIDDEYADRRDPPSVKELVTFYRGVFSRGQMELECIVASLIYVERLLKAARGRFRLRSSNWRPTLLSAMIMASKVCDDLSMWNADFSHICRAFDLARINALEAALLQAYGFNATVSASEYAKYYFHLRSMAARLGLSDRNNDPLDIQAARLVAARSRLRFPEGSRRALMAANNSDNKDTADKNNATSNTSSPQPSDPLAPPVFVRRAQSIGVASQIERYAKTTPKPRAAILEEIVDMAPTNTP